MASPIGVPGLAPSLTNQELLSISSDKFFMSTIRDGREDTGMMPFAHLGRKNVRAIVAYLRSHARDPNRAEQVDSQPDARGDPRLGKQWYDYVCSTCHGLDGNGYEAGGTGRLAQRRRVEQLELKELEARYAALIARLGIRR